MPYQRALAHRLGFESGSPDYETTALPTELSRLLIGWPGYLVFFTFLHWLRLVQIWCGKPPIKDLSVFIELCVLLKIRNMMCLTLYVITKKQSGFAGPYLNKHYVVQFPSSSVIYLKFVVICVVIICICSDCKGITYTYGACHHEMSPVGQQFYSCF